VRRSTLPATVAYIAIVVLAVLGAAAYSIRSHSAFACQATGYASDSYLAYCGSTGFGDYDYGAFWFNLEPQATQAAARADVLFLGNSRTQYALSADATRTWFETAGVSWYLLGFAYDGNFHFADPLLRKLQPKARVYVINLDLFFEPQPTLPARAVMQERSAKGRYKDKKLWQQAHELVCSRTPTVCGQEASFFRSRATGAWRPIGGRFTGKAVSFDDRINPKVVGSYVRSGQDFLARLPVQPECQILTVVPTVDTPIATLGAIASALGRQLIAPQVNDLQTFDASHLDAPSAERWAKAFLAAAGPAIQRCTGTQSSSTSTAVNSTWPHVVP